MIRVDPTKNLSWILLQADDLDPMKAIPIAAFLTKMDARTFVRGELRQGYVKTDYALWDALNNNFVDLEL